MESQPQNPDFRINPENFHPCEQHLIDAHTIPKLYPPTYGREP